MTFVVIATRYVNYFFKIAGSAHTIITKYFIVKQDGAPAHRARETVELLQTEAPALIPPTLWPPNSPDLNPVDYKIWSVMQEKVYRYQIHDVTELRIEEAWDEMDQRVIEESIDQWRTRLRVCVDAQGGQFEHKL